MALENFVLMQKKEFFNHDLSEASCIKTEHSIYVGGCDVAIRLLHAALWKPEGDNYTS